MTHQEILDNVPAKSEIHGTLDACFFRKFKGEMFLFVEYYKPESEVFEILVYCLDEDFQMGAATDAGCEIKPGGTLDQEPYGYLRDIFVRQSFRRRGITT